jgi:Mlc titration factor MtfA (ptsG expression regulator)
MLSFLDRWRERRILRRQPIAEADWRAALDHSPALKRLDASDQARLRVLATLLLHDKSLEPVQGLALTSAMRALLGALACLPILKLGLHWYRGWHSIVLYPDTFVPERERIDEAGVVHRHHVPMHGEAWQQGPVILAWEAIAHPGTASHNVVIHEMAHKLDMLNGEANGFPPLHARMNRRAWVQVLGSAYRQLEQRVEAGYPPPLDPYGLESPAEFFAVASEAFFETPRKLRNFSPELYQQLALFYRQRPLPE